MTTIVITKWHEENPNDWVAVKSYTKPIVLLDRDRSLMMLTRRLMGRTDVTYGRAWGMGIGKDYPISERLGA